MFGIMAVMMRQSVVVKRSWISRALIVVIVIESFALVSRLNKEMRGGSEAHHVYMQLAATVRCEGTNIRLVCMESHGIRFSCKTRTNLILPATTHTYLPKK